jgi:hypothetical protein
MKFVRQQVKRFRASRARRRCLRPRGVVFRLASLPCLCLALEFVGVEGLTSILDKFPEAHAQFRSGIFKHLQCVIGMHA